MNNNEPIEQRKFIAHDESALARMACPLQEGRATLVITGHKVAINKYGQFYKRIFFDGIQMVDGKEVKGKLSDYFALEGKNLIKYKRLCEDIGKPEVYASEDPHDERLIGLAIEAELKWSNNEAFPGMNISHYVKSENAAKVAREFYSHEQQKKQEAVSELPDDDIPF